MKQRSARCSFGCFLRRLLVFLFAVAVYGIGIPSANASEAPAGWFHVVRLDARTFAISEPQYWQQNVSYLLLGEREALLFDTGPGIYSIRALVKTLTALPILVLPSHLHFDHIGRIQEFERIALLDNPSLRAQVNQGRFVESPSQHMLQSTAAFHVDRWIRDGEEVDLGKRKVLMISTPGHTPDSVTLVERHAKRAFTGDLINRLVTLCNVPGSDIQEMSASLRHVRSLLPANGRAYEAHSERALEPAELEMLSSGIAAIAAGHAQSKPMCLGGQPMRSFEIGAFSVVLRNRADESLRPLQSNIETLDWRGGACSK